MDIHQWESSVQVSLETELLRLVQLYLEDGLEMDMHQSEDGLVMAIYQRGRLYIHCSGLLGDRTPSQKILLGRS